MAQWVKALEPGLTAHTKEINTKKQNSRIGMVVFVMLFCS